MKLPLKYIAILVILSLAGIFSYQAYWLGGLYRTMRMSDYNEMMLRVERMRKDSTDHGEVSVSAGFEKDGTQNKAYVRSTTSIDRNGEKEETTTQQVIHQKSDAISMNISDNSSVQAIVTRDDIAASDSGDVLFIERNKDRSKAQWLNPDSAQKKLEAAVKDTGNSPQAALRAKDGLDVILRDQNSMLELATYFQRGLHSGLDIISDPDVLVYDSLLSLQLKDRGITLPYRLEHIYTSDKDAPYTFVDTLAVAGTAGYTPGPDAKQYNYAFDLNTHQSYRLWIEPVTQLVLKQMSGILATSFVILIILIPDNIIHSVCKALLCHIGRPDSGELNQRQFSVRKFSINKEASLNFGVLAFYRIIFNLKFIHTFFRNVHFKFNIAVFTGQHAVSRHSFIIGINLRCLLAVAFHITDVI